MISLSVCRHVLHISLVPRLFRESLGTRLLTLVMLHLAKVYTVFLFGPLTVL